MYLFDYVLTNLIDYFDYNISYLIKNVIFQII